jgi:hypothetical protein
MFALKFYDEFRTQRDRYTASLRKALWFEDRADAESARCGLERVVEIVVQETKNEALTAWACVSISRALEAAIWRGDIEPLAGRALVAQIDNATQIFTVKN